MKIPAYVLNPPEVPGLPPIAPRELNSLTESQLRSQQRRNPLKFSPKDSFVKRVEVAGFELSYSSMQKLELASARLTDIKCFRESVPLKLTVMR